jgi:hypothetical protein
VLVYSVALMQPHQRPHYPHYLTLDADPVGHQVAGQHPVKQPGQLLPVGLMQRLGVRQVHRVTP